MFSGNNFFFQISAVRMGYVPRPGHYRNIAELLGIQYHMMEVSNHPLYEV